MSPSEGSADPCAFTSISPMTESLPEFLVVHLKKIDPVADFSGYPPKVNSSTGRTYFVKSGLPSENEQLVGEAKSLEAIGAAAPGLAPHIFAYGTEAAGRPYFIS